MNQLLKAKCGGQKSCTAKVANGFKYIAWYPWTTSGMENQNMLSGAISPKHQEFHPGKSLLRHLVSPNMVANSGVHPNIDCYSFVADLV
jgi:hypothetical protein